jgi:glycerol-3-phosphate dehydrogenase
MSVADVAIIGAGVIGCAIARRFTLEGARVAVLEKAQDVLDGASKGNSAILHTGFDAIPGSLEQSCVAAGYDEYLAIHERLGLPLMRCGALVLAWTEDEEAHLPELMELARQNGVSDIELLSSAQLLSLEPNLSPKVRAGFSVPREFVIDPWSAPHAYLLQALANGAELRLDCAVRGAEFDGAEWRLDTVRGEVQAGVVVNAAGLYGDLVDEMLVGKRDFHIRPRKGQFVVYDKAAAKLASRILLPVPSKTTKGIVVCGTAFGNLLVGPTAEDQDDRENAVLVPETLSALTGRGEEIIPALAGMEVTAIYAGLRPATEFKDYQIRVHERLHLITVGGIRSTGLTSALGVARHVFEHYRAMGTATTPLADPIWPQVAAISEFAKRRWQQPQNGGIVCHCEKVTRAEIEAALEGALAPQSFAGLKRRTRVAMGRCQGFYCSAELALLTKGRLKYPMAGTSDDR